jgi:hypothetical protein
MNQVSIYQLWKAGELDRDEQLGILKNHIIPYCKIYDEYLKQRARGMNFIAACEQTAEVMNTSSDTVRRAVGTVV